MLDLLSSSIFPDTFAERDATPVGPGRDAVNKRLSDLRSPDAPLKEYNYAGYAAQPPEVSNPNQNIVNPNVPPIDSGRFSQHPADGSNVADPYQRLIEDTFAEREASPVGPKRDALNKRLSDLRSPDAPLEEYNYAGYAAQPSKVSNPNQNIVNPNVPPKKTLKDTGL